MQHMKLRLQNCAPSSFLEEYIPGAARKGMEWQYFVGDCSAPAVQEQAKQNFIIGLNEVFAPGDPNFCQREKLCDLGNIRVTCGRTQRRRKRSAQVTSTGHQDIFNVPIADISLCSL